jgi:hypothetical protein
MNGEIVTAAAAAGLMAGEAIDWLASRHAARQEPQPANPAWESGAEEAFLPIPDLAPEVPQSRYDRLRQKVNPWLSGIALSGAAVGLSTAMLLSPAAKAHEHIQPGVGVVVDNSGQTAASYGGNSSGTPMSTTIDSYVKAFEASSKLRASMFYTYQGIVKPASANQILQAGVFGQADLGDGISNALTGNSAVFVLAGDSEVGDPTYSPAYLDGLTAEARNQGERVFVMNTVPSKAADAATTELKQVATETGGQYFSAADTTPAQFISKENSELLPSKTEITTRVDSDKAYWAAALGISLVGGVIGTLKRRETVIGRVFKQSRRNR